MHGWWYDSVLIAMYHIIIISMWVQHGNDACDLMWCGWKWWVKCWHTIWYHMIWHDVLWYGMWYHVMSCCIYYGAVCQYELRIEMYWRWWCRMGWNRKRFDMICCVIIGMLYLRHCDMIWNDHLVWMRYGIRWDQLRCSVMRWDGMIR
jgi:hypothetical protein